ncbi:MAG: hypothetical protein KatS3mg030_098 [Saprospiraceae bacterium]|nr:MAG: hypothetical protein KatS3mg030_098 [Saprospiraceae bacterium]
MKLSTLLLMLGLASPALAQLQSGLRLENFSGTSGLIIDPTAHFNNPLRWDVNLAGAGLFLDNNYVFIRNSSTLDLLRNVDERTIFLRADELEGPVGRDTYVIDFHTARRRHYAAVASYIDGPALAVRIGSQHSIGFFTRAAVWGSSYDIPAKFSYYPYDRRPFYDTFRVPMLEGAMIGWKEYGLNYAVKIPTYYGSLRFGINGRALVGYESAYVYSQKAFDYTKLPNNEIFIEGAMGTFGFTTTNLDIDNFDLVRNGNGLAVDVAASIAYGEDDEGNYLWRASMSLTNLGSLRFNHAEQHHIMADSSRLALDDYRHYTDKLMDLKDLARQFSYNTMGDSSASYIGDRFRISMPAAVNLQVDVSIAPNLFANALVVQRLPTPDPSPKSPNLIAVTPRFEHRWFSASLPVVFYEWSDLRLGAALRLGYLVVGSDNLLSHFGHRDFYGTDIYVALKLNPFELHLSDIFGGTRSSQGPKRRGKVKCYKF